MASTNRETRRVTVVFGSETSEAEGGFKKVRGEAEKTHGVTGKLSEMFDKLGPGILASLGAESVGVAFTKVIGGASDLNETVSKTQQVFKTTGDSVLQWSDTSASAMGISKRAALENVSAFGNIYEQMGLTEKTAETMSKRMVTLASDFASFANAEPADVMDALQSATRGEYDALQRYVPTVNAAAVQTEALSETHKKAAGNLTSAENATALYNLVLKNAGAAVGDFGRTSNSAANQQRILSASLEDAAAKIGNFILPAYQALLSIVTHIGPINLAIAGLGIAFGSKITAGVAAARTGLMTWIGTMKAAAAEAMVTSGATSRLGGALAATGATARAAGSKLGAMAGASSLISKLSVAFLVGQGAAYLFGKEVNIQVTKLSDSLATFAKTGQVTGEALKTIGNSSKYAQSIASYISQADSAVGKFGRTMESITGASGFDVSIENTEKRVKAIDGALTQLATSGHMDEAKASFDKLAATFIAHGASMDQVRAKFSDFTAELDRVNDAQKEAARFAGGDLTTVFKNLSPVFNGAVTDAKLFETALGTVGKAGEDTNTKLAEYGTVLSAVGGSQITTAEKAKTFKDGLSAIEDSAGSTAVKANTLVGVFNSIADAQLNAKQKGDLLKATLDQLHGAAMSQIEAEESQFTSTTALSDAFKKNGSALDLNSAKTAKQRERVLANRDALEAALTATRDKYVADITAGVNADTARGKYDKATKAILNQIDPTDRNKKSVQNLVSAYGGIPPAKKTNITLTGDTAALNAMVKSFALQKALASNWTKAKADDYYTQLYRQYVIPNFIGPVAPQHLSSGGAVGGWSPHKRADNIPTLLTAREWVHPVDAVDYYGENTMEAIRTRAIPADLLQAAAHGVIPDMFTHPKGYASGGSVTGGPVWNFPIKETIDNPANLSSLQKQFAAMVASGVLGGQAGGRGFAWELATLHQKFGNFGVYATTGGHHATNSWHYKGRAVDVQPIHAMAQWIHDTYGGSTLELISPWTELNIKNGRSYAYSRALQAEHGAFGNNAHIHWAYDQGGMLPPGTTVAHNNTGRPEYVLTEDQMSGAKVTVNVTVQGNVTTEKQLAESIATSVRDALLRKAARNGGRTGL